MTVLRPDALLSDLGAALPDWLVGQRWYRAKGHATPPVTVGRMTVLAGGEPALVHAEVAAGAGDAYQLWLGVRAEVPETLRHAMIGTSGGLWVYDASYDGELMGIVLDLVARDAEVAGVRFQPEPGVGLESGLRARHLGVEQSNTSVVFGSRYILKLYRRPAPGPARDVDLHRLLASAGSEHIAEPLGSIEATGDPGHEVVLGFLQRFLPDAADGWAMATASVRDLLAEEDLHADEVGGDFAAEAHRLGAAVAEVHRALAATGSEEGAEYLDNQAALMHGRLSEVLNEVPELAENEAELRAAFDGLRTVDSLRVQQVHGDLHLGQVLRSTAGWVLIDFEGEPAASPRQRRLPRSPLADVAGMLRSFDYAAFHLATSAEEVRQPLARAAEWADRNRTAFCDGYAEVADDPREQPALLRALELDKAVYEVGYEHHNRPDWLPIPLAAIRRAEVP